MHGRHLNRTRANQLEEELRAQDPASHRADRSADQEAAHAGIIAVTSITFDVRTERSACEKPADAADDRAGNNASLRSCASSWSIAPGCLSKPVRADRRQGRGASRP